MLTKLDFDKINAIEFGSKDYYSAETFAILQGEVDALRAVKERVSKILDEVKPMDLLDEIKFSKVKRAIWLEKHNCVRRLDRKMNKIEDLVNNGLVTNEVLLVNERELSMRSSLEQIYVDAKTFFDKYKKQFSVAIFVYYEVISKELINVERRLDNCLGNKFLKEEYLIRG